ncbi:MAG TPA: ABC transporter permease [bacterium]|jgi:ABC-2 type transport system permease protein|nr:ABC transporter permease [bacterium]
MNFRRLWAVVRKEILHLVRDRRTLATIITLPIMQLFLYGYLTNDVTHIPTAVFDQSRTPESRTLLAAFANTTYLDMKYYADSFNGVQRLIDGGDAKIGILIPPDYATRLRSGRTAQVGVIVDASEPTSANVVLGLAGGIGQSLSTQLIIQRAGRLGLPPPVQLVDVRPRAWYNPTLSNVYFIVPGVIAVVLVFVTTIQAVTVIVRERERGTIEQLVVTPITGLELLLGKIIPLIGLGYLEITITLLLASLWFGMPIKGSLLLLYVLSLAFFFSTLGIGVLISTVSKTFQQAVQVAQLLLLPSILLSGFIFPRESLPYWLQVIGGAFPLTYFVVVIRGILIKGVGIEALWKQILPLLGLGLLFFGVAISRFQKRVD